MGQVAGGIDRAQQLLALPGGYHLTTRITCGQPRPQPRPSSAGELLVGGQQQFADAVQRIWLAASMPEGGLLGPPADLIDCRVGQPDGMEVVHDHPGVAERGDPMEGLLATHPDRVRTLTAVRSINPDPSAIVDLCGRFGANGITAFTTVTVEPLSNVHSRMFAPAIGIPEDPATGSASGALGAYLVQNGIVPMNPKIEIVIEQGYEVERPSRILVQIDSDGHAIQSVKVGGECVMVIEGTLSF